MIFEIGHCHLTQNLVYLINHIPQEGLFISMKFFQDVTWSYSLHIRKN